MTQPSTQSLQPAAGGVEALPERLAEALNGAQLPGLDALRAISVFLVIFYHHDYPVPGGLGVLAFFVLSGFLITWLLLKEQERYGDISLRHFYLRRALRIFPAFYAYWFLVIGILLVLGKTLDRGQAVASFFYVSNYYQAVVGHVSSGLSHAWSLGVEEQFYLIWPLMLRLLLRRGANPAPRLMGAIAAIWIWRAAGEYGGFLSDAWLYESFDTRADQLLIGCLLAVALRRNLAPGLFRRVCAHPALPWLTIGLIAASEIYIWPRRPQHSVAFTLQAPLIAVLIAQWMTWSSARTWAWLNWGWLRYLGRISYSTYLYQQLASSVHPLAARLGVPPIAVGLPFALIAASLSFWLIEQPFLTLKDRLGHRRVPAATGS